MSILNEHTGFQSVVHNLSHMFFCRKCMIYSEEKHFLYNDSKSHKFCTCFVYCCNKRHDLAVITPNLLQIERSLLFVLITGHGLKWVILFLQIFLAQLCICRVGPYASLCFFLSACLSVWVCESYVRYRTMLCTIFWLLISMTIRCKSASL